MEEEFKLSRKKAANASRVVERTSVSVKEPDLTDSSWTKSPISSLHFMYILARIFLLAAEVGAKEQFFLGDLAFALDGLEEPEAPSVVNCWIVELRKATTCSMHSSR